MMRQDRQNQSRKGINKMVILEDLGAPHLPKVSTPIVVGDDNIIIESTNPQSAFEQYTREAGKMGGEKVRERGGNVL